MMGGALRNRFLLTCAFATYFTLAAVQCVAAGTETSDDDDLARILQPLINAHDGDAAVSVKHLATGATFHHRQDVVMPTASLIKLPVMIEAYRQVAEGTLDLTSTITLTNDDKVPGSGILTKHFSDGASLTVRDAIRLMIAYSDNTATNLVIDQIGLVSTARTMETLGLPQTKLHSKVYRGSTSVFPERSKAYGLGSTTSSEMITVLERLQRNELVSPEASDEMLEHLLACEHTEMIPALLPEDVRVAHKSGAVSNARTDAGILYTDSGAIAICVLTTNNRDQSWGDSNAAEVFGARIARAVVEHFNPPDASDSASRSILRQGDFGEMVEAVQRTLNARMEPSAELAVDGDFGPATLAAVTEFQRSKHLEATGVVGSDVWKALSPLITEEQPVPAPDVVNSEKLSVDEAYTLDGPPFVTCRAWAIADADTGELLFSDHPDEPLDIASTTKIMTAFVVLKLAEENSDVLNEVVTFSHRADRTRGSTAAIRAGEQLPVAEVLYGLMLPSGNDAAVALAEHFGSRLADIGSPGSSPSQQDSLDAFVEVMNRMAVELGMSNTTYRNPNGLTEDGHQSTAADVLKLATAAMALPAFRDYANTRQRGCTVIGPGGYTRNVLWKNTNRLLSIDGYAGIKTGTTTAAGACLVCAATRQGRSLLLVVLGSDSSDARYVDARNLYRWAWPQLRPR